MSDIWSSVSAVPSNNCTSSHAIVNQSYSTTLNCSCSEQYILAT